MEAESPGTVEETSKEGDLGRGRLRGSHSEWKGGGVEEKETAGDKDSGRRRPLSRETCLE